MRYFEDSVTAGEWDDVEKYLSGFTKVDDNRYSMKIFFEIRKQKYLEALDKYVSCFLYTCQEDSTVLLSHFTWKGDEDDALKVQYLHVFLICFFFCFP